MADNEEITHTQTPSEPDLGGESPCFAHLFGCGLGDDGEAPLPLTSPLGDQTTGSGSTGG